MGTEKRLKKLCIKADDKYMDDASTDMSYGEYVAEYLLAHGVFVPPCKIGDKVWGIKRLKTGAHIVQGEVYQMYFSDDMRLCISVKRVCWGFWGIDVFGTKAEAEAAIREQRNDG